jgi:hypothetical protein
MFWKLIMLALLLWGVGLYFSITLGGFLYLVPAVALVLVVVRQVGKRPNSAFGRWRPASDKASRHGRQ